ncbi:MAG: ABC-2 family transporter protein [Thermoflexales bacterium]|nr:ABC-2 family transporter protein [Thermoflexales bacterium]
MRWIRAYLALARAGWASVLEYRAQIVIWMSTSLLMMIMLAVWLGISRAGPVSGFSSSDFVAYFIVGWVVRNLTAVWVSWELEYAVRSGQLSPALLRPIHPVHKEIAWHWVEKGFRMAIVLPIATLALALTPGISLALDLLSVVAFVVSVFLAWLIRFMIDYLIGILSFWSSQSTALSTGMEGIQLVLTGTIAPLALFPQAVQDVLRWTPFPYLLNFPVEIVMGRLSTEGIASGLAAQLGWSALGIVAAWVVWRTGIRRYAAFGA